MLAVVCLIVTVLPSRAFAAKDEQVAFKDSSGEVHGEKTFDSEVTVDKTALTEAIKKAPTKGYYKENDKFNGKEVSKDGFWAEYQAVLATARLINETESSRLIQKQVDEAIVEIDKAINKLIPETQINTSDLYEEIRVAEDWSTEIRNFLEETVKPFEKAKKDAKEYMSSLFKEDGTPTAENIVANQGKADFYKDALDQATGKLLGKTCFEKIEREAKSIGVLDKLFPYVENTGYTQESWNKFVEAREAAHALLKEKPPKKGVTAPADRAEYAEKTKAYWLSCYGLQSTGEVKASIYITDDFGQRVPTYFSGETMRYAGDYTLKEGTLKELIRKTGIKDDEISMGSNTGIYSADWAVHINGILVRTPVFYNDMGAMVSVYLADFEGEKEGSWKEIKIKNGDRVVLSKIEIPRIPRPEGSIVSDDLVFYRASKQVGILSFTDESNRTVKEGEPMSFSAQWKKSYINTYTGEAQQNCTAKLAVYGPQNSDGTYPKNPVLGEVSSYGKPANLTIYKAGKYMVTAFDPQANDYKNEFFPSYKAGAKPVVVTVKPAEKEKVEALRNEYLPKLDRAFDKYSEYELGAAYTKAKELYKKTKKTMTETNSMQTILDQFANFQSEMAKMEEAAAQNALDNEFEDVMNVFPTTAEFEKGAKYKDGMKDLAGWLKAKYENASPGQQEKLTKEQTARYKAIQKIYGKDGSSLEKAGKGSVTIKLNDDSFKDYVQLTKQSVSRKEAVPFWATADEWGVEEPGTATEWGTTVDNLVIGKDNIFFNPSIKPEYKGKYEITGYKVNDSKMMPVSKPDYLSESWLRPGWLFKEGNNTVTVFIKANEAIEILRGKSLEIIKAEFVKYKRTDYEEDGWKKLVGAYEAGLEKIKEGKTADEINLVVDNAQKTMSGVAKRPKGKLGKVIVKIGNNVFPSSEGAPWAGELLGEGIEVELTDESTMMNCIVEALKIHEKATGKKHNIEGAGSGYISSIDGVGEFGGGAGSGWMGTLNDWFTNRGFSEFTVADGKLHDGDVISLEYTRDLGEDIRGGWNGYTTLHKLSLTNGKLSPAFSGETNSYILTMDSGKTETKLDFTNTNRAFQSRAYKNSYEPLASSWISSGDTVPVTGGNVLYIGIANSKWPAMGGAKENIYDITIVTSESHDIVIKKISDMTEQREKLGKENMTQVNLARMAYNALNEESKAKVTNYDKLIHYEKEVKDAKSVEALRKLLSKVPRLDKITLKDKQALLDAEKAYNELSPEARKILSVGDENKLAASKEQIRLLEAKESATKDVESYKDPKDYRDAEKSELGNLVKAAKDAIGKTEEPSALAKIVAEAKAKMDALKTGAQYEAEEAKTIGEFKKILNKIPAPEKITFAHAEAIKEARNKYDALTREAKAKVEKADESKLIEVEKAYTKISTTPTLKMTTEGDINEGNGVLANGNQAVYTKKESKGVVFKITDGTFANFVSPWKKVFVGDKELTYGKDYTATEGSIVIRLDREYLETLAAGTYTIKVYEKVGYAQGTLIIKGDEDPGDDKTKPEPTPTPKPDPHNPGGTTGDTKDGKSKGGKASRTGDDSPMTWWIVTLMLAGCAYVSMETRRRKTLK